MRFGKGEPSARERIVRALTELCSERGFRGFDLEAVLARAGLEESAFYRHFADLEDCFCEVMQECAFEILSRSWSVYAAEQGWANQIRAVAYQSLRFVQEDPPRSQTILVEAEWAGERARLIHDQAVEALSSFIDLGRGELADPDSISPTTADAIGGALVSQIRAMVERREYDSFTALMPEMMYSVVLPYLGTEAALRELHIPPGSRVPSQLEEGRDVPPGHRLGGPAGGEHHLQRPTV